LRTYSLRPDLSVAGQTTVPAGLGDRFENELTIAPNCRIDLSFYDRGYSQPARRPDLRDELGRRPDVADRAGDAAGVRPVDVGRAELEAERLPALHRRLQRSDLDERGVRR